jgi:hypothetical protein
MLRVFTPLLGMLTGCGGGLFYIEVEETAQTTVSGGTLLEELLGDLGFEEFVTMDITASEELQNQGVEPGDIVNVTLIAFDLTVTDPADGDLTFLEEMAVYVEGDDLPRVRIAHLDDFPPGQQQVSFELDDVDLTPYVTGESMGIDTEVTGRSPSEDTTILASFVVDVGVTSQGAWSQWRQSRED